MMAIPKNSIMYVKLYPALLLEYPTFAWAKTVSNDNVVILLIVYSYIYKTCRQNL